MREFHLTSDHLEALAIAHACVVNGAVPGHYRETTSGRWELVTPDEPLLRTRSPREGDSRERRALAIILGHATALLRNLRGGPTARLIHSAAVWGLSLESQPEAQGESNAVAQGD